MISYPIGYNMYILGYDFSMRYNILKYIYIINIEYIYLIDMIF